MNDVLLTVLVWQVMLLGSWLVLRRLRRLERSLRPPCYAQLGVLREQVVGLRTEQAADAGAMAQRTREVEWSVAQVEDGLRVLIQHQEKLSRVLLERIRQLEAALIAETTADPDDRLTRSTSEQLTDTAPTSSNLGQSPRARSSRSRATDRPSDGRSSW